MRLSESVVLPECLTVRQLHALDTELAPWGEDGVKFTSGVHPLIITLDAAYKAKVLDFDATVEMAPAEARLLAERVNALAEQARAVPKA